MLDKSTFIFIMMACIIYSIYSLFVVLQIKPDPGVFAKSFLPNDIMFISTDKLLPLSRFTNPSAGSGAASGGRSSRGGGGGRAMRFVFRIPLS